MVLPSTPFVEVLVRTGLYSGKRLTDRLPKLSRITQSYRKVVCRVKYRSKVNELRVYFRFAYSSILRRIQEGISLLRSETRCKPWGTHRTLSHGVCSLISTPWHEFWFALLHATPPTTCNAHTHLELCFQEGVA